MIIKNTTMTEFLMMTLKTTTTKYSKKTRASHSSSNQEPYIDFRKLVDKLEQAEITAKLEETENLELKCVNIFHKNISQVINIHDSDTELAEKITQMLNTYEKI